MHRTHGWPFLAFIAAIELAAPVSAAPQHVVSAFLCTDEYVFRLLPRERIAALSFLAADRNPVVSTIVDRVKGITLVHASAEEILSLHPDAVVLYAGTAPRLHVQLKTAGVPIIDVAWANSLADVRRITLALGRTLGEEPRARALLAAMDATLAAAGQARPPVRTLIYGPNGYATSDGVTEDIFARVGLINVASVTGETRDGTIPIESVVASPPELLLLSGADPNRPSFANLVLHHPALVSLARRIDVAQISLTPFLCPGPWSVDVAPKLAELGRQARALARAQTRP